MTANWSALANVKTLITTCGGGASEGVYRNLNVGSYIGNNLQAVLRSREIVQEQVGLPVAYLNQIHDTIVVNATETLGNTSDADASVDAMDTVACASVITDCLPVLLCGKAGMVIATVRAGWRGLVGGVLQNIIVTMRVEPLEIMVYLTPVIGPDVFEVRQDVLDTFCTPVPEAADVFEDIDGDKYLADIYALVRVTLYHEGVNMVYSDTHCTVLECDTFFSYRYDGQTGRVISLVWLEKQDLRHQKQGCLKCFPPTVSGGLNIIRYNPTVP